MIRLAAIIDTETGGLDPAKDPCIEVAVTVYDLALAAPVTSFSSLIRSESNAAEKVNRISPELLKTAAEAKSVWSRVSAVIEGCDVFIAHRAEFDRSFAPEPLRSSRPWICSKFHIDWPMGNYGDGLVHLALAHGVGVVHAHRAATDVDILSRLFTRVDRMVDGSAGMALTLVHRAMRPRHKLQAMVSFQDKDLAKSAGFQWEPEKKRWVREAFEDQTFDFPTKEVT